MDSIRGRRTSGARCVALVGPYLSGKTTLLEAILFRTGATQRQGKISDKTTVGDASQEARLHGMSVELNIASTQYLDESYTFLDCPGSIEFNQDIGTALVGCDVAVVVCEADEKKVAAILATDLGLLEGTPEHTQLLNCWRACREREGWKVS